MDGILPRGLNKNKKEFNKAKKEEKMQGSINLYPIQCNSSDADLNITLIITDEGMEDLDLVIWEPGSDPYAGDASTYYINEEDDLPQEFFSISPPEEGLYYICVLGSNNAANYTLEITGNDIEPQ